ncbi:MAG: dynamin family protein [Ignavibacteria bacterium]
MITISMIEEYKHKLAKLEKICSEASLIIPGIGTFKRLLNKNTFDVAVAGEFPYCKSTIINALLGMDILPANLTAATAGITYISFAETPEIVLTYSDSSKKKFEYNTGFLEKPVASEPAGTAHVKFIEIYIPSDILKGGIRIIDIPGTTDTEESHVQLPETNTVACGTMYPGTAHNPNMLRENIIADDINNLSFTLNKVDIINDSDLVVIVDESHLLIRENIGRDLRIYPLSAADYLREIISNDNNSVVRNQFKAFKDDLLNFILLGSKKNIHTSVHYNYHLRKIKAQAKELVSVEISGLSLPEEMTAEKKNELNNCLAGYESEAKKLSEDITLEFNKLINKLDQSLCGLITEIYQHIELNFEQLGMEMNYLITSLEAFIKNRLETWKDCNQPLINEHLESICKEIHLRLGKALQTVNADINHYQKIRFKGTNITGLKNISKEVSDHHEEKTSMLLSVASVHSYAAMAATGITLAPAAMLIMPPDMYHIQKRKIKGRETIKKSILAGLEDASKDFRNEVLNGLNNSMQLIINEIKNIEMNRLSGIKSQIENAETEHNNIRSEIEQKIIFYNNLYSQIDHL